MCIYTCIYNVYTCTYIQLFALAIMGGGVLIAVELLVIALGLLLSVVWNMCMGLDLI